MIDVPELDVFLKTIYYSFNCNAPIYKDVLSKETQVQSSYMYSLQGTFMRFKELIEKSELGFSFTVSRCTSMYGACELKTLYDPFLILAAPYLKIYPRLLYSDGFINKTPEFEKHDYYFRYYPKMLVRVYAKTGENTKLLPSTHWILGSHNLDAKGRTMISYNVAVNVNLHTLVEEELHGQIHNLHSTNTTQSVVKQIETTNPCLRKEIEENLNRILSTEEKKFKDLGNIIHIEFASELRNMQCFIDKFEGDVIQSAEINSPSDPTVQVPQPNQPTETPKTN
jgi:hypothetical protein